MNEKLDSSLGTYKVLQKRVLSVVLYISSSANRQNTPTDDLVNTNIGNHILCDIFPNTTYFRHLFIGHYLSHEKGKHPQSMMENFVLYLGHDVTRTTLDL